ncbi:hydrogenase nickel incorporation protein HypA [Grimontia sp. AD028]|uniref:hydrogenase maturation nickel metallochaperone HypA n=1 Tax=Grimontia sp. AD028 TaxID=1581149 RepID=UPI00061AFDAD|nr:hydrogenase maturation nickel metallochaperone HypA [Grimontia sp. AD028]KKD62462.1 hydrogenase nickel incorporation protein HypA [Grimontia sp. AD028]
MHELSICESIVTTLKSQAALHDFSRVKILRLEIGQFSGVEAEALRFCFPIVALGTVAEDADMEITLVPGQGWCDSCQCTSEMQERYSPCQQCGRHGLTLSAGDEMRIANVEVE